MKISLTLLLTIMVHACKDNDHANDTNTHYIRLNDSVLYEFSFDSLGNLMEMGKCNSDSIIYDKYCEFSKEGLIKNIVLRVSDSLIEGNLYRYDTIGRLYSINEFKDSVIDGYYVKYGYNNLISEEGYYKNNTLDLYTKYDINGEIKNIRMGFDVEYNKSNYKFGDTVIITYELKGCLDSCWLKELRFKNSDTLWRENYKDKEMRNFKGEFKFVLNKKVDEECIVFVHVGIPNDSIGSYFEAIDTVFVE